jgi:hypothetical protein
VRTLRKPQKLVYRLPITWLVLFTLSPDILIGVSSELSYKKSIFLWI